MAEAEGRHRERDREGGRTKRKIERSRVPRLNNKYQG